MNTVKEVIMKYCEGTAKGDVSLLKSLFHKDAIMSGDLFDNKLVVGNPNLFFNDVDGQVEKNYSYVIENIEIVGDIATAKLVETGLKGNSFVNFFQLQNIDSQWLIVAKLFTTI